MYVYARKILNMQTIYSTFQKKILIEKNILIKTVKWKLCVLTTKQNRFTIS